MRPDAVHWSPLIRCLVNQGGLYPADFIMFRLVYLLQHSFTVNIKEKDILLCTFFMQNRLGHNLTRG